MLPRFVTAYKDKNKFIHLYFFPGLDDENNLDWISKDLCADCNSRMNVYLKTNINNKVESDNRSGLKKWLGKIFK